MKKLNLPIFLLSTLFFLGCAKDDTKTEKELETPLLPPLMPEMEFSGTEAKAIGYIKTTSLPKLIQKAVSVAQAIKPWTSSGYASSDGGISTREILHSLRWIRRHRLLLWYLTIFVDKQITCPVLFWP
jgi:hypothetical protein